MWEAFLATSIFLLAVSYLPLLNHPHWLFRIWDFGKIQLTAVLALTLLLGLFITRPPAIFFAVEMLLFSTIIYHLIVLANYTPIFSKKTVSRPAESSAKIQIISANVYLFNNDFESFISLIRNHTPDAVLTMESDDKWENALAGLEKDYPYQIKVPLKNTYGMHFYSKIEIQKQHVHFFVADDIPSIEAHLKTEDGYEFVFFGVHPPPPSPTEETTSKERDGDLLSVAKAVNAIQKPVFVIGDFNNVAWSKSSVLFKKKSELIDPRIGRGFISTYHAKYKLLRFPIDLLFHSEEIYIEELRTLDNFGSDHLPVFCEFYIGKDSPEQRLEIEKTDAEEDQEVETMIQEGKEEQGDRAAVATAD